MFTKKTLLTVCFMLLPHHASAGWFSSFFRPSMTQPEYVVTIMLAPAGDAQNPGRTIDDSFERTLTTQFVERLKMELEDQHAAIKILTTHHPGHTMIPLQNAHYANRAHVDLYLSVHFYKEQGTKSALYLYHFNNTPFITKPSELSFIPYQQAHMISYNDTKKYSILFRTHLKNTAQFECNDIYAIPFKPLIGIQAPAIGLEIGLKNSTAWQDFVTPVANSIKPLIEAIKSQHGT